MWNIIHNVGLHGMFGFNAYQYIQYICPVKDLIYWIILFIFVSVSDANIKTRKDKESWRKNKDYEGDESLSQCL